MSRYDGEDMAWDGGPPGAESDPVPQLWGSSAPPSKGIVQMAYSFLQQTGPPDPPFDFTGDDFLYTTSANVPGPPTQPLDKKETSSLPRSRRSPPSSHDRHNRKKSYTKHSKSRSRSPRRRFKKSKSRSLSKEKSSRSYNKPSHSFNESKFCNSRKQRKFSSSSSDGSKSPNQPLPKERVYKHKEDVPARIDSKMKDFENEKMKSRKSSRRSRSPSPESSSSKSSSFSERHYNHPKGGQSLTNTSTFQARRQKNSSPEPSGSDGYYKGQIKPNRPQNSRLDHKNSCRSKNFSGPSDHRPQTTEEHSTYPPVSHIYPAPPAATPFRNDGSFLEMFKKLQETQKAELETASTTVPELEKPELKRPSLPMVGKRRGGRVLKTGMVKKPKSIEEQTVDNNPTDAWSLYLKEVKKYKDSSCDEECRMCPLFK